MIVNLHLIKVLQALEMQHFQDLVTDHSRVMFERGSMFEACRITDDVMKAQALWTINSVTNNHYFNSNAITSARFKVMFPDSPITNQLS